MCYQIWYGGWGPWLFLSPILWPCPFPYPFHVPFPLSNNPPAKWKDGHRVTWKLRRLSREQVTRGHNIVADWWAEASNPQPQPNPTPKLGAPTPSHRLTNSHNTNWSIKNTSVLNSITPTILAKIKVQVKQYSYLLLLFPVKDSIFL